MSEFMTPKNCDVSVKKAIMQIRRGLGSRGYPVHAGMTLTDLTASRLVWSDAAKALASKDLIDLVAGTANKIGVADDTNGGVTLTIPNNVTLVNLTTSSGRIVKVSRVTGATTLDTTHHHVFADTDGGAYVVTLPTGVAGTEYRIVNTGSSGNNLTVTPDGAELLLGANSNFILFDGEALLIVYEVTEGWF